MKHLKDENSALGSLCVPVEDICIQEMLGYELMDKNTRLDKAEVSYTSGVGTLSLSAKCAKESKQ